MQKKSQNNFYSHKKYAILTENAQKVLFAKNTRGCVKSQQWRVFFSQKLPKLSKNYDDQNKSNITDITDIF